MKMSERCSYCQGKAVAWIIIPGSPARPGRKPLPAYQISACFEHEQSPNFTANITVAKSKVGARILRTVTEPQT
jgi:hypothetical protein